MKNLFLACAVILGLLLIAGPAAAETCDSNTCITTNPCMTASCVEIEVGNSFCSITPADPVPSCDDGNPCTTGDACFSVNEDLSVCTGTAAPQGTICEPDDNPCTSDVCDTAGTCSHGPAAQGTACGSDNNLCTSDVCDAFGTCMHEPVPAGGACVGGSCGASGDCIPLTCADVQMTCLWPPNHQFIPVTLTVRGAASSGVSVDRVMSDEPTAYAKGAGGEAKWPDAYFSLAQGPNGPADPATALLRSERSGLDKGKAGNFGRVYTIEYSATNNFDTTCNGIVKYCVPHDQSAPGKACNCVDDGARYEAWKKTSGDV